MKPLSVCVGCGEQDCFDQLSHHPHDVYCTNCGMLYDCHTLEPIPKEDT